MAGVMSLMQPQGQQGPMPGQAPQQPMPGMMQQQSAPTPGAMVSQLSAMPFEQLAQFYSNPRPQSPPLWAVISAIAEKQKQAKAMQMAQGQQVMAQNQQMQAQPPVAAEVVMSAEQTPGMEEQDTVMAALGGMMHGYAGGGAVAFTNGGNPTVEQILQKAPSARTPEENEILRAAGVELTRRTLPEGGVSALNKMLEGPFFRRLFTGDTYKLSPEELAKRTDTGATTERMFRALGGSQFVEPTVAAAQETPVTPSAARPDIPRFTAQELERYVKTAAPAPAPSPAPAAPLRQPAAVTKPQEPPQPGLPGLMGPQIDPSVLMAREAQQNIARALERSGKLTPEEIAARGGIDKLLGESASSFEEERKRREALAQQRMQEAQARFERPGYMDMAGIGRLLGGMKGAKTFYQGAVGAGEAAGKYQEDKEAALRAAQEKFDLSGKEMFDLRRLQSQVEMDRAKLVEARASGNAQRSVQAALKLGESQQNLAKFESDVADKAAGRRLQEEGIKVQREQIASSERIAELNRQAQAALRNLPGPEQQMVENAIKSLMASNPGMAYHEAYDKVRGAGKGLEEKAEFANLRQQATMLQNELKEALSMDPLGKSPRVAQLRTKLDSIYQQLGGGTVGGGASNDPLGIRK